MVVHAEANFVGTQDVRTARLISIRSETRDFQKPRHPGEGRDPGKPASYWIPAFAGMTEDAVYGQTLIK